MADVTNIFPNPVFQNNIDGVVVYNSSTSRDLVPVPLADGVEYAIHVTDTAGTHYVRAFIDLTGATAGRPITQSFDLYWPAAMVGQQLYTIFRETGGALGLKGHGATLLTPVEGWNRMASTTTLVDNDRTGGYWSMWVDTRSVGDEWYLTRYQIEEAATAGVITPQFDASGTLLPAFAWTGTPHASASTYTAPPAASSITSRIIGLGSVTS